MDANNETWRSRMPKDLREKVVSNIIDTLRRCYTPTREEGMLKLFQIARVFEEKKFQAAINEQEYILQISSKMLLYEKIALARLAPCSQSKLGNPEGVVKLPDSGAAMLIRNQHSMNVGGGVQLSGAASAQGSGQQLLSKSLQNNLDEDLIQRDVTGLRPSISDTRGLRDAAVFNSSAQNEMLSRFAQNQQRSREQQEHNQQQEKKQQLSQQHSFEQQQHLQQQQPYHSNVTVQVQQPLLQKEHHQVVQAQLWQRQKVQEIQCGALQSQLQKSQRPDLSHHVGQEPQPQELQHPQSVTQQTQQQRIQQLAVLNQQQLQFSQIQKHQKHQVCPDSSTACVDVLPAQQELQHHQIPEEPSQPQPQQQQVEQQHFLLSEIWQPDNQQMPIYGCGQPPTSILYANSSPPMLQNMTPVTEQPGMSSFHQIEVSEAQLPAPSTYVLYHSSET